jgi:hypothetical protein
MNFVIESSLEPTERMSAFLLTDTMRPDSPKNIIKIDEIVAIQMLLSIA